VFIQVIHGKVGDADGLRDAVERWRDKVAPGASGWLGSTGGATADGTAIAVVRFESAQAARRNSERPEQQRWWNEASRCFDGDVTFHDCDDAMMFLGGGSDDAGFVQVIQGRLSDPQRFRTFMSQPMDALKDARPEILGGTIGIDADGTFTETVAFRSEAEARENEQNAMPDDMRVAFEAEMAQVQDMAYLDLHHPWFTSARQA